MSNKNNKCGEEIVENVDNRRELSKNVDCAT